MLRRTHLCLLLLGIASLTFLAGCGDSTVDPVDSMAGKGTLRVQLTDAPADFLATAEVTISSVYVKAGTELETEGEDNTNRVELLPENQEPLTFDLLTLRDGVQALLAETPLPAGTYGKLYMIVDDATVTLTEAYEFRDGTKTASLKVPSGQQSGIKVRLNEPITLEEGQFIELVVDFDVNDNFVIQGNPNTPAGINGILFKPVLKEKARGSSE